MNNREPARWQFWIDRGGTFTDCIGVDPADGSLRVTKILSSDVAPLQGIREILGLADDAPIPPCDVRMGTTVATNALLERRGMKTGLIITRGFKDLLAIGNQVRPDIFALNIDRPSPLYSVAVEIGGRVDFRNRRISELSTADVEHAIEALRKCGARSVAIVLMHSYTHNELEQEITDQLQDRGFDFVVPSHEVSPELGLVARADTAVVDAYLTPLLEQYLAGLEKSLPGSKLFVMQSSGGLCESRRFRGKNAILSGPAGGVVAYAHTARELELEHVIGFDMGGTSTDVSCFDGRIEHRFDNEVAGVRVRAPMMAIHTVAAGGGSICGYRGFRLVVGPGSAGSKPGPLCYGDPLAESIALTDVNRHLGRIVDDHFPFELDPSRGRQALETLALEVLGKSPREPGVDGATELAVGFTQIANASMAEAIRKVTIARGRDARDYTLAVFGGAGGQHACQVARLLGIRTLVFDPLSGVLSALGMGLADVSWHGSADAGRSSLNADTLRGLEPMWRKMEDRGQCELVAEGHDVAGSQLSRRLDLRYRGTDHPLSIRADPDAHALRTSFEQAHRQRFGFIRAGDAIEIVTARVELVVNSRARDVRHQAEEAGPPVAARQHSMWTEKQYEQVPVYEQAALGPDTNILGPAIITSSTGTIVVERGFEVSMTKGRLIATDHDPRLQVSGDDQADPIRLEIFGNLFMAVAEQMGTVLQRTAVSTNIRDRLDFSCAVFDGDGNLVANAPHIPVHLGAMGETVRAIRDRIRELEPGMVLASNDPYSGGSHLPDVTVVTPVFDAEGTLRFFTASRGHHADIGGITPGSMPPFSTHLGQEGVVIEPQVIVRDDVFREKSVRQLLASGKHPARRVDDNIADLKAQVAANQSGAAQLSAIVSRYSVDTVLAYMGHLQDNAAQQVADEIGKLDDGKHTFRDQLDDGTMIQVELAVTGDKMRVDFAGTGAESAGNLNAPKAVTVAAVLYVLRCMVGSSIPLNSGCLRPVEIHIPEPSVLAPSPGRAVAGGNVETSQRIVDVLLGALGLAAASQGTMNNLTFGTNDLAYYETIAGGSGATATADGASGVHTHMTNTRITDPEVLEVNFPVILRRFGLRPGSGGDGSHRGGLGVVREFELTEPMEVSILSERRTTSPFGLAGGCHGQPGRNTVNGRDIGGKAHLDLSAGDVVTVETPGGGGYGTPGQPIQAKHESE